MQGAYPVITLCGSTRFKDEFYAAQKRLTLEGNIVISVGLFGHSGDEEVWDGMDEGTLASMQSVKATTNLLKLRLRFQVVEKEKESLYWQSLKLKKLRRLNSREREGK